MAKERTTEFNEFSYEVIEEVAILSESKTRWQKKLQRISWNHGFPKWDIREWSQPDPTTGHVKMSKGITLTDAEMDVIRGLILHGRL